MSDPVVYFHTKETNVRGVLADCLNKAEDWGLVVVVALSKDGEDVLIGHSDGRLLHKVGLCEFAAHTFKEDMYNGV